MNTQQSNQQQAQPYVAQPIGQAASAPLLPANTEEVSQVAQLGYN